MNQETLMSAVDQIQQCLTGLITLGIAEDGIHVHVHRKWHLIIPYSTIEAGREAIENDIRQAKSKYKDHMDLGPTLSGVDGKDITFIIDDIDPAGYETWGDSMRSMRCRCMSDAFEPVAPEPNPFQPWKKNHWHPKRRQK